MGWPDFEVCWEIINKNPGWKKYLVWHWGSWENFEASFRRSHPKERDEKQKGDDRRTNRMIRQVEDFAKMCNPKHGGTVGPCPECSLIPGKRAKILHLGDNRKAFYRRNSGSFGEGFLLNNPVVLVLSIKDENARKVVGTCKAIRQLKVRDHVTFVRETVDGAHVVVKTDGGARYAVPKDIWNDGGYFEPLCIVEYGNGGTWTVEKSNLVPFREENGQPLGPKNTTIEVGCRNCNDLGRVLSEYSLGDHPMPDLPNDSSPLPPKVDVLVSGRRRLQSRPVLTIHELLEECIANGYKPDAK